MGSYNYYLKISKIFLGIAYWKWSRGMGSWYFTAWQIHRASSFASWLLRVVFRAAFTLCSLLRVSPVFCLSTKCSICCSFFWVFLMALVTSTAGTSLGASAAAEAAEGPPGLTAAAAPLPVSLSCSYWLSKCGDRCWELCREYIHRFRKRRSMTHQEQIADILKKSSIWAE